jgi:hypothetical protein
VRTDAAIYSIKSSTTMRGRALDTRPTPGRPGPTSNDFSLPRVALVRRARAEYQDGPHRRRLDRVPVVLRGGEVDLVAAADLLVHGQHEGNGGVAAAGRPVVHLGADRDVGRRLAAGAAAVGRARSDEEDAAPCR